MKRVYLKSDMPLVHAVTEWLGGEAQITPAGVPALDHLIVLVPTRQAGRRLREALAESFPSGCIPPRTMPASTLLQPQEGAGQPVITRAESVALLSRILTDLDLKEYPALFPAKGHPRNQNFTWGLGVATQLLQLWNTLEESALTMNDVAAQIGALLNGEDLDVEIDRWRDLAAVETIFFKDITNSGLTPQPIAIKNAVASPSLPEGCREIVLPALVDGVPALYQALENISGQTEITVLIQFDGDADQAFDKWGVPLHSFWSGVDSPLIALSDDQIFPAADSMEQADAVARYFADIPKDEALPALGMADANLFNELESAFLNRGIRIHNPASTSLAGSSLAQLILQIKNFSRKAPYPLLAAFMRQSDTARLLGLDAGSYAQLLKTLDEIQNRHIPQSVEEVLQFCNQELNELNALAEPKSYQKERIPGLQTLSNAISTLLGLVSPSEDKNPVDQLITALKEFFKGRILTDANNIDRELGAAAAKILDIRDDLKSPLMEKTVAGNELSLIFDEMLQNSSYQLEASQTTEILTEGWLELIWNPSAEIVVSGFNEGSIPVSTVGHAFLPDRLRKALNMICNDLRTARDTYLLYSLTASRQPGAVQIHLERVNADGDVRKPSRLLFNCDDSTLAARAKRLFAESETTPPERPRVLPDKWKLNLPVPDEKQNRQSFSVSEISGYMKCPFTFYLDCILGMGEQDDRAEEMDALVFGTLCHEAIERFGESPLASSTDAGKISEFLEAQVQELSRKHYGAPQPAVIQLQTQTAARRLAFFAEVQAERTAEGWRIAVGEERLQYTVDGISIRGRADRIDFHPERNIVQIIDFKTWNKTPADDGKANFATRSAAAAEFAINRGVHLYSIDGKEGYALTDMQLPLYMLMMPARYLRDQETKVECAYFVLGESRSQCKCFAWNLEEHRQTILSDLDTLIKSIKQGIYWPPSPLDQWKYSYEALFLNEPEGEIGDAWMKDQTRREEVLKCASSKVRECVSKNL